MTQKSIRIEHPMPISPMRDDEDEYEDDNHVDNDYQFINTTMID